MKEERKYLIKETALMGIFSTVIMDIGYFLTVFVFKIVQPTMRPNHLGRWVLNMFQGIFIHDDIRRADAFLLEKPVSLLTHYITGIMLVSVFLWLRRKSKIFSGSVCMGVVFGWVTVILPWFIMYPAMGFGFLGLDCPRNTNYVLLGLLNHSFYGIGITLWLGVARRFVMRDEKA